MNGHDVKHRDCYESLAAMKDAGGMDLILTSPPYPDARKVEAYGAEFDTSMAGYQKLGDAVFEALKPGGVCALNIDGPVRIWRPELGESERSLIAFKVAIDWAERVGFRYVEHCAYVRDGCPISGDDCNPRFRSGWEPLHVLARPGRAPHFDRRAFTRPAKYAGQKKSRDSSHDRSGTKRRAKRSPVRDRRCITSAERFHASSATVDGDHTAAFSRELADAYALCYSPPGGLVGDPFVGSGTVAFACHRHGRRFIGGDLGTRQRDGLRWADIVTDGLRQTTLFGGMDDPSDTPKGGA
jgi:DNA modification methylase